MGKCSRRDFLVGSAAGACGLAGSQLLPMAAFAEDKPADMTIARWNGKPDLTADEIKNVAVQLTEKALAGVGGLGRFVGKGDVVWIKPNMGWDRTPELAANCNPDLIATVVRLCLDAGAKAVKIGDNPCDKADMTYKTSGIVDAVSPLGAEAIFLDPTRFRKTAINGERVKELRLCPEILDCDLVINIAVAKHHVLARGTFCMKNYMGIMDNRGSFHQAMAPSLVDLTRFMKPKISILDGVRVLKAHGPKGGNPADVVLKTTVAAGVDIVALDALGAELIGCKPSEIKSIVKAEEAGLGKSDYRSLALKEVAVS
jgi:uncharacterized protein (DUF362 family)